MTQQRKTGTRRRRPAVPPTLTPEPQAEPNIVVPLGILQGIHQYLGTRPHAEVRGLVEAVEGLPTVEVWLEQNTPPPEPES